MTDDLLTRERLQLLFAELDRELAAAHVQGEIFMFGGAAMVFGYSARDSTYDVDAVWKPHGTVQSAAHRLARQHGLPSSWLNEQATSYLPRNFTPTGRITYQGRALTVLLASPELLLAMKVAASRQGDTQDIIWLTRHLNLAGQPQTVIELAERILSEKLPAGKIQNVYETVGPLRQDTPTPILRAIELIEILDRYDVDFVLVGGLAAAIHGATRLTTNMDIVVETSPTNHEHLAAALNELNAAIHIEDRTASAPVGHIGRDTWRTDLGDINVMAAIPTATPGLYARYEQLAEHAERRQLDNGTPVLVSHLDDIIESKLALDRPTDRVAVHELLELQRQRNIAQTSITSQRSPTQPTQQTGPAQRGGIHQA